MEPRSFDMYTERLRDALESTTDVVGLVTLGSTADAAFRDVWSDHDFWVITKPGAQDALLDDLWWLPDAGDILILIRHGKRYRTVVYSNRHKVEFAVLDVEEAYAGQLERYRVLIDRGRVAEMAESIRQRTLDRAQSSAAWADALQDLCVTVWTACERYSRGELLSARQYIDGFAVNQLLQLISVNTNDTSNAGIDVLDMRRRLEMRSPELAEAIRSVLDQPLLDAAQGLLGIAQRELKASTPTLAWGVVTQVQGWISDLAREQERPD